MKRCGFTLIEALVSLVILGMGIVGCLSALGTLDRSEALSQNYETMQRLAFHKLDELEVTGQLSTSTSGDFSDQSETRYEWQTTVQPSGVDNLYHIEFTIKTKNSSSGPQTSFDTLRYVAPTTTTTTTGGTS